MLIRIAAIVWLSGCSFAISGPDPNRPASKPPHCETSKGLIVLDAAIAAGAGIAGASLLGDHESGGGAIMLLAGALYAGSALTANTRVDRCRTETREYQAAVGIAPLPVVATRPVDPYDAQPAVAARPPAPPPPPPPPPRRDVDAFHVSLDAPPSVQPEPVLQPPPPPDDTWRQFWREAN